MAHFQNMSKTLEGVCYCTHIYVTVPRYMLLYPDICYCTQIYLTVPRYTLLYPDICCCTQIYVIVHKYVTVPRYVTVHRYVTVRRYMLLYPNMLLYPDTCYCTQIYATLPRYMLPTATVRGTVFLCLRTPHLISFLDFYPTLLRPPIPGFLQHTSRILNLKCTRFIYIYIVHSKNMLYSPIFIIFPINFLQVTRQFMLYDIRYIYEPQLGFHPVAGVRKLVRKQKIENCIHEGNQ